MNDAHSEIPVTQEDMQTLWKLAIATLKHAMFGGVATFQINPTPGLSEKRGAFVSLEKSGQLRGCMGCVQPDTQLPETIKEAALDAALKDRRFSPLQAEEWPELQLEVSVLSPIVPLQNISDIQIGKTGLIIQKGTHNGILLPQVAVDYRLNPESFLIQLCRKAQLPDTTWKHAEIFSFTVQTIGGTING